ncbi:MAG: helix-turn-helix domain-containing protein [Actinobacteria bacterium]|nr:helix-turn-helix domain-containing protein [Actinomycetota bacterium]
MRTNDTHAMHDDAGTAAHTPPAVRGRSWPLLLLAAPAFVAIWSGWVGLGDLTGFGVVHPLPGIADGFTLNTAITLPIGVETYAAYALKVWLSAGVPDRARAFARWSALGSLVLGAAGQVAYHLMSAAGVTQAPWQITAAVACLPVAVLGMGAALAHLVHSTDPADPGTHGVVEVTATVVKANAGVVAAARPSSTPPAPRSSRSSSRSSGSSSPSGSSSDTGLRVARLRAQHPNLSTVEIARRLGVTDRTVRRYLAAGAAPAAVTVTRPTVPDEAGPAGVSDGRDTARAGSGVAA